MGKKRRSAPVDDEEEQWGQGARALAAQTQGNEAIAERENKCRAHLRALNKQFAEYVLVFWFFFSCSCVGIVLLLTSRPPQSLYIV